MSNDHTITVRLTHNQHRALTDAIEAGAFADQNRQLTALLQHNRDHVSISNMHENEIDNLHSAIRAITRAGLGQPL